MSNNIPDIATQAPVAQETLPVAAIVCIAVGGYIVVVAIILTIRQCLLARGMCGDCEICGKEGQPQCCDCCIALGDACNCCANPSMRSCLDTMCPNRKQMDCVDILLCQCCAGAGGQTCFDCGQCGCNCTCNPDCENINCLCFELQAKPSQLQTTIQTQQPLPPV